jgi:hypothetical protein
MGWFRKDPAAEIWEKSEPRPDGDIEAARRIRAVCEAAAVSARKIAHFGRIDPDEAERYQAARRHAIALARNVHDDLLHDTALRDIVSLCMKANDVETAAAMAREIRTELVRKAMASEHPYFAGAGAPNASAPNPATRRQ